MRLETTGVLNRQTQSMSEKHDVSKDKEKGSDSRILIGATTITP